MKRVTMLMLALLMGSCSLVRAQDNLFGDKFPNLDSQATGEWWSKKPAGRNAQQIVEMNVPREQVVAFALYTQAAGVLKVTAQLYPLKPDEPREARLELQRAGKWQLAATSPVHYPGWDAHFRIANWDNTQDVRYRVLHAEQASFEGLIRRDPIDKPELVIAALSCNSSRTKGPRPELIENILSQNPDLLFFAGDQSYHHTEHTAGWLEWGLQFRKILADRPTVTIPDDHDIGQGNLWGESGRRAATSAGPDGGYFYPPAYVNQVQRQQTWHLPDPFDPTPVENGIGVYYTRLHVGGVDFAILEDRKFKSGPEGKIPKLGPRPDHINDPAYDRASIDLPGLQLLGDRQHRFLEHWSQDWAGSELKCVLSQTAFCGAVHMHGKRDGRLLADLDSNAWPQAGRNQALRLIRQAWAPHICGDQHLAVTVKHGIDAFGDGPYGFTVPAIVNTIYGRWWHPLNELPGANPIAESPLPWIGDYEDGLGNRISMMAYANPTDVTDEKQRGDGYGLVRINKQTRQTTFECWPRFAKVKDGPSGQYPGWPITIEMDKNDGRKVLGHLARVEFEGIDRPVVQVTDEATGEVLYTVRTPSTAFRPPVYSAGPFTVRLGKDRPDGKTLRSQRAIPKS